MRRFVSLLMIFAVLAGSIWLEQYWSNDNAPVARVVPNGKVRAIDGDSFHLGDGEVRLYAIDAPEAQQNCADASGKDYPCGKQAAQALNIMLKQDGLACDQNARDRYGRMVARCSTTATPDIGEAMVHNGWAVALTFTKRTEYADAERRAQQAKRGVWQGAFMRPSDWRNRPK